MQSRTGHLRGRDATTTAGRRARDRRSRFPAPGIAEVAAAQDLGPAHRRQLQLAHGAEDRQVRHVDLACDARAVPPLGTDTRGAASEVPAALAGLELAAAVPIQRLGAGTTRVVSRCNDWFAVVFLQVEALAGRPSHGGADAHLVGIGHTEKPLI